MLLSSPGINWTWYVELEITANLAIVQREYRLHHVQDTHPADNLIAGHYRIIERTGAPYYPRVAIAIDITLTDEDTRRVPFAEPVDRWDLTRPMSPARG